MKTFAQFKSEINSSVNKMTEIVNTDRLMESLKKIREKGGNIQEETRVCEKLRQIAETVFPNTEMYDQIISLINNETIREENVVQKKFKEIRVSEVFRHGGEWYKKLTKTSFVNLMSEKRHFASDDMPDFHVYIDSTDVLGEQRFKFINEDLPANAVGDAPGNVAGVSDNDPPVKPRAKFANAHLFDVDSETFNKCRMGKNKYAHWSKYIDKQSETGKEIYNYATKYPRKPIVVRHKDSGIMLYARRK